MLWRRENLSHLQRRRLSGMRRCWRQAYVSIGSWLCENATANELRSTGESADPDREPSTVRHAEVRQRIRPDATGKAQAQRHQPAASALKVRRIAQELTSAYRDGPQDSTSAPR